MDLREEIPAQEVSTCPDESVKKFRDKRKSESPYKEVENTRDKRLRQIKVRCMAENHLSSYRAAARERKRRNRELKRRGITEKSGLKSKYRTHYVKKTVKNTYKQLPRSPAERAEVLSKLAEQALAKLQSQAKLPKRNLDLLIKRE